MKPKCHVCGKSLEGAVYARVTFDGFVTSALNGTTFLVHAHPCLALNFPDADDEWPQRAYTGAGPGTEPTLDSLR